MKNTIIDYITIVILSLMIALVTLYPTIDNVITVKAYSRHFTLETNKGTTLSEYVTVDGDSILLESVNDDINYYVTIDTSTSTILDVKEF